MSRQCSFVKADGAACTAYALKSSPEDKPRCRVHQAMDAGTWKQTAASMGRRRAHQRRSQVEAKPRTWLEPGLKLGELLAILAPALEATDSLLPGEPLWNVRLAAVGTLLAAFPRTYRETPEKVAELLGQLLPAHVLDRQQIQAQAIYEGLRASWDSIEGVRFSRLKGIWVKPYPGHMVAPWEDAEKIQASRPAPIAPERAPVKHLPDNQVALMREARAALLVPEEEPDEESIEVDTNVALPY